MTRSVARSIGVGFVACALAWLAPLAAAQGAMSLDERVACQAALEDLVWSETSWPESNAQPKPARAQILSDGALRARVEDQLRMEMVLAQDYGIHIDAATLQRELDRMAVGSQAPDRLKQRFDALGNDAERIAECLARPHLVGQQLRAAHAADLATRVEARPFQAWWTKRRAASGLMPSAPVATTLHLPDITGQAADVSKAAADTWRVEPMGTPSGPAVRVLHTAVWTGSEMIVWGGDDGDLLNTGGRYQPATDVWTPTSLTDAPSPRYQHTAVWTGTEMIVWGGCAEGSCGTQTGGRYHPATDTWTATSLTDAASARYLHTAVWTGAEMIVWGGYDGIGLRSGGRYDPATNTWTATAPTDAPSPRYHHTAVWTGTDMIIWGGQTSSGGLNSGGRYDPATNSWTATSPTLAPSPRYQHTAVWTGADMIIWGGDDGSSSLNTGGRYDPADDVWTETSLSNAPSARHWHTAVWTGADMIVWGGYDGSRFNTGGRYHPGSDAWADTSLINAPSARYEHTAVWADTVMIVWGGCCSSDRMGVYYPMATTQASTTAILADAPDPSALGAAASVSVHVSGSATAPVDGQVLVTASSGETCTDSTPTPLDADTASFVCNLVFASAGGRTLTAAFSGSATHDDSVTAGAEPHSVKSTSLVAITAADPDPSFSGQSLTLAFHVAGSTPTGTVSISSQIEGLLAGCTSVAVDSGACTVTAGELAAGTHQLTASYTGDENHFPSTSASVEHRVLEFVIDSTTPVNGIAGAPLAAADRPRVRVRDHNGEGVAGIDILFELASGGGLATGTTVSTGDDGRAAVGGWTLGTRAGANTLTARVNGAAGLSPIHTFTAQGAERADVSLAKSSVTTQAGPGDIVTYRIVVTHEAGPSDARAVDILDALPIGLDVVTATWLCVGVGGASCDVPDGSGDVEATASIPVGGSVTVTLTATVTAAAPETLTNIAVADLTSGTDATPTNNSDDHSLAVVSVDTGPCSIFCDGFDGLGE